LVFIVPSRWSQQLEWTGNEWNISYWSVMGGSTNTAKNIGTVGTGIVATGNRTKVEAYDDVS